jgi:hypothetical protein
MWQKWQTFRRDPWASVSWRVRRVVPSLLSAWAKHQLHRHGVLETLVPFHARQPSSAFGPEYVDLWFLYRTVIARKPHVVLEFGSGCSTVVLAQAVWKNRAQFPQRGDYFYSIDADPFWARTTAQAMPEHLREVCQVEYSPLVEIEHAGTLGFRHAKVPQVIPNLVYLDGPGLTPTRQMAIDVLDMEERWPDDFYLVIDDRQANTRFFQTALRRAYRFKRRYGGHFVRTQMFELVT